MLQFVVGSILQAFTQSRTGDKEGRTLLQRHREEWEMELRAREMYEAIKLMQGMKGGFGAGWKEISQKENRVSLCAHWSALVPCKATASQGDTWHPFADRYMDRLCHPHTFFHPNPL